MDTWNEIETLVLKKDKNGNAVHCGKALCEDARDNIVFSDKAGRLVAIKGLKGMMVIDTPDVL